MSNPIASPPLREVCIRAPAAITQSLLPYPLRRGAAKEMLYGGVRVLHLVQQPPAVIHHSSHELALPTPVQERDDDRLEIQYIGERVSPINVGNRTKHSSILFRSKDVYKRFLQHNRPRMSSSDALLPNKDIYISAPGHLDPSSVLAGVGKAGGRPRQSVESFCGGSVKLNPSSIGISYSMKYGYYTGNDVSEPSSQAAGGALRGRDHPIVQKNRSRLFHRHREDLSIFTATSSVCSLRGFLPFQMWKPYTDFYHPAIRSVTRSSPAGRLKQEFLNRKGQGERKVQRYLPQQDRDTRGYHPEKFY